jgi:DNA mismatch repair protein MLH1
LFCSGATQISVTVRDGGLRLLQIRDNGCGIHPGDLPILCHRHTTSRIQTLGFRGEALCSISFVSRLQIVSMRADAELGCKATYQNSEMTTETAEPCAAVPGTCITVEDMFYNIPNRRKALGSANDEFRRIYDVVSKYAVFSTGKLLA